MKQANGKNFSSREVNNHLQNIYRDENGHMADISRLETRQQKGPFRTLIIFGLILLILAGVALAGFWVFNKYAPDSIKQTVIDSGDVELQIEAPQQLDSGGEITYLVKYKNKKKIDLNKISLNVRYPAGLLVASSQPAPEAKTDTAGDLVKEDNWNLGTLPAGQTGQVEIKGRLIAEKDSSQNLFVVLYYEPANFSSQFQKEASAATVIQSVPVEITVEGTKQLDTTGNVDLTFKYANMTDHDLANIMVEIKYPDGFTQGATDSKPVSGSNNQWQIPTLEKGGKGEIKLQGKFAANVSGNQDFIAKVSIKEGDKDYFLLSQVTHTIAVVSGDLLIELKINGSDQSGAANFSDTLNYSITYQNNGKHILKDLQASIVLNPSADFVQWTTLNDRYDGTLDEFEAGKIITWTKKEVPNLAELTPRDKGVIDFSFKLSQSAGQLAGDLALQSSAVIKVGFVDKDQVNAESKSNTLILKLNSNLALSAYGRYFDDQGRSVGSGPIPPQIGQTTTYVINWQLNNSVHEVKDVTVSTTLPSSVAWIGKRDLSAGDLQYDATTRRVSWTINRMPTTLNLKYTASFAVSITPIATDGGKILVLTGDSGLTATDQVTGTVINQFSGSVTTDLVNDPLAKGKGLVQK